MSDLVPLKFRPPTVIESLMGSLQRALTSVDSVDPKSLAGMTGALHATIVYLALRVEEGDVKMNGVISRLGELALALNMTRLGQSHPALEVKTSHAQRRAYTAVQRKFLENCMGCSDALMADGMSRREADQQVQKWAKNQAGRLNIAMSGKDALKHIRKRIGWSSRTCPFQGLRPRESEDDRETVNFWVENYRRQIEEFCDEWAFQ